MEHLDSSPRSIVAIPEPKGDGNAANVEDSNGNGWQVYVPGMVNRNAATPISAAVERPIRR